MSVSAQESSTTEFARDVVNPAGYIGYEGCIDKGIRAGFATPKERLGILPNLTPAAGWKSRASRARKVK
jgi:hypothetical protein